MALITCAECGEAISKKATKCPKCGSPMKKKTSFSTWLVLGVLALFAAGYFSSGPGTSIRSSDVSKDEPSAKQVAMENIKLEFSWKKVGFDNVLLVDFHITNASQYLVKDIRVRCTHYAKTGTKLGRNRATIYDVVPARTTKTFKDINMGFIHTQADSTSCVITDIQL